MVVESGAPQASKWVWGEIQSIDVDGKSLVIKHLDYETADEITKKIASSMSI